MDGHPLLYYINVIFLLNQGYNNSISRARGLQSVDLLRFTIDLEIRLFSNSGFEPISLSSFSYSC